METESHPDVVMPTCSLPKLLKGQKALVTGSSSGIGSAVAIAIAQAGADVVVNFAGDQDGANDVVNQIKNGGGNVIFTCPFNDKPAGDRVLPWPTRTPSG